MPNTVIIWQILSKQCYKACCKRGEGQICVISFEFPVTERTRILLRLEYLYGRLAYFIGKDHPHDHHAALQVLFELMETASRADLKADLLQELERQKQMLEALRDNPNVAEETLEGVLEEIERASSQLLALTGKFGQNLRENEWLMAIKQRAGIPGGTCQFDLRPTTCGSSARPKCGARICAAGPRR